MSEKLNNLLSAQEALKETEKRIADVEDLLTGVQEGTVLRMYPTFKGLFPVGPIPIDQVKLRESDKTVLIQGVRAVLEDLAFERNHELRAIEGMLK